MVSFDEQGKIVGRDALEILAGKPPQDIPIVHGPSLYLFDWRELQRWKLDQNRLPAGSTVLFRRPTLWEQYRRTLQIGLLVLGSLSLLTIFLLFERKQLHAARNEQMRLSGLLIHAQDEERSRLAGEIHDDFSQRLAVLSLGLETVAEGIPESLQETNRQMRELMESASELGADLHTLSTVCIPRHSRGLASLREWHRSARNSALNKAWRLHFPSRTCRAPCPLRLRFVCFASSRKHSEMCRNTVGQLMRR